MFLNESCLKFLFHTTQLRKPHDIQTRFNVQRQFNNLQVLFYIRISVISKKRFIKQLKKQNNKCESFGVLKNTMYEFC